MRPFYSRKIYTARNILLLFIALIFLVYFSAYFKIYLYFEDKPQWYVHISSEYRHNYNYNNSIKYADKALALDPHNINAQKLKIGSMLDDYYNFDFNSFIDYLNTSDFNSNDSTGFYYRAIGIASYLKGSVNESLMYLKKAEEINQSDPYCQTWIGIIYLKENELEKAIYHFDKSINISTKNKKEYKENLFKDFTEFSHAGKGYAFMKMNNYKEADKEFKLSSSCVLCKEEMYMYMSLINSH